MAFLKKMTLAFMAGCFLLTGISQVTAQYPYPYPYPSVYAPYAGPGGAMAGQAQVIGAYGNFQSQQQQAQITHQQALQEQVKTEKMQFDWKKYEAANTPTFGQEQAYIKTLKEKRLLTNPTPGEIASGEAFNILLPMLNDMANHGVFGAPIPISPGVLDKINVTVPFSGGSAGVLKGGGKLDFPLVLQGETSQRLNNEVQQAVAMLSSGTLDFKFYQVIRADMDKLRLEHKKKFHKEEIDGGSYLIGTRYLDSLEGSIKVLEQPNAAKLFDGTYKASGSNVQELVQNMTKQGLTFAPAIPGDEPAYTSLYNSMVTFTTTAKTGGFQVKMSPGSQVPFAPKGKIGS